MATNPTETRVFPLALASEGDHLRIAAIGAGKELSRKLRDLGLPVGSEVTVIHCPFEGLMVLAHNDTRVALGAGMAHRILMAPVGGDQR